MEFFWPLSGAPPAAFSPRPTASIGYDDDDAALSSALSSPGGGSPCACGGRWTPSDADDVVGVTAEGTLLYRRDAPESCVLFSTPQIPQLPQLTQLTQLPLRQRWDWDTTGESWTAEEVQWCASLVRYCARENESAAEVEALVAAVDEWREAQGQRPAKALERRLQQQKEHESEWPPFILRW